MRPVPAGDVFSGDSLDVTLGEGRDFVLLSGSVTSTRWTALS